MCWVGILRVVMIDCWGWGCPLSHCWHWWGCLYLVCSRMNPLVYIFNKISE